MGSPDVESESKLSRRRFLRLAGSVAVAGAVVSQVGTLAGGMLKQEKNISSSATGALAKRGGSRPVNGLDSEFLPDAAALGTPPAPNSFSIFWITDTQFLSERNPALFKMMTNWIAKHWAAYNGKLVIHTGDMVETGSVEREWEHANDAMNVLTSNGIPYTWCAGNHDDLVLGDPTSGWKGNVWGAPAFDPTTMSAFVNGIQYAEWVGDFHNGMDTALAFAANGLNFLVINVEWNALGPVIGWAEEILSDPRFAGYYAILAPHAYVNAEGQDFDPSQGPTMADFLRDFVPMVNRHPSVFLTLNGHFGTDAGYFTPSPVRGRNQLMFDRQDCCDIPTDLTGRGIDDSDAATSDTDKVGGATITILNFDTDNNQIHVSTYDVYGGKWRTDFGNQYSVTMFQNPPPRPAGDAAYPPLEVSSVQT